LICYGETKVLKVRYALIKADLVEIQRSQYLFEEKKWFQVVALPRGR